MEPFKLPGHVRTPHQLIKGEDRTEWSSYSNEGMTTLNDTKRSQILTIASTPSDALPYFRVNVITTDLATNTPETKYNRTKPCPRVQSPCETSITDNPCYSDTRSFRNFTLADTSPGAPFSTSGILVRPTSATSEPCGHTYSRKKSRKVGSKLNCLKTGSASSLELEFEPLLAKHVTFMDQMPKKPKVQIKSHKTRSYPKPCISRSSMIGLFDTPLEDKYQEIHDYYNSEAISGFINHYKIQTLADTQKSGGQLAALPPKVTPDMVKRQRDPTYVPSHNPKVTSFSPVHNYEEIDDIVTNKDRTLPKKPSGVTTQTAKSVTIKET